jgi:UPF0716 family protein affecting phage T7 exclusion
VGREIRVTPWLHAALVGAAAGLAYLEGLGQELGGLWLTVAVIVLSRAFGALLSNTPKLARRRVATRQQQLDELRLLVGRLIAATHGLSNQASVIVVEIEHVIERLDEKDT